jgi:hypothetical protein
VLLGFIDNAHAAFGELAHDFVPEFALDGKQTAHRGMVWNCPELSSLHY